MRTLTGILIIALLVSSCTERQPKIDYGKQNQTDSITMDSVATDTSKVLVAELPVFFDSTDYLMHPIGLIDLNDRAKGILKSSSSYDRGYSYSEFSVENSRNDYFSGSITNLVFEKITNGNKRLLTNKVLNITHVQYLRDLSKKINRHYILYSAIDKDLNHDGKLDYQDINSLYISRIDGTEFKKITGNFHEYYGGKLIVQNVKYYFRTIEDTDKDGLFTKKDKYHYYCIDFSLDPYKIVEYNPLKLIIK